MNPKALIPLMIGLGIAGYAGKLGLDQLRNAQAKPVDVVQLWTPIEDIPRGTAITAEMLKAYPLPADFAPAGAIVEKEKLVGRVPHTGAPAGVPILESMLFPPGTPAGIHVPKGFRAVAVKIDESSGVDNHLQPGAFVDVVGLFSVRTNNRTETIAKTIIQNVEVAAVGQKLAPDKPGPGVSGSASKAGPAKPARAVTLLVKPEQVPTLHLAEQRGKIKLSMRSGGGVDVATAAQVNEDQLLGLEEAKPGSGSEEPSFLDQVAGMFAKWGAREQPQPEQQAEPEPEPVAEPQPEIVWHMTIFNGEDKRILAWVAGKPNEPIDLNPDGPSIFEDDNWRQPQRPNRKQRRGGDRLPPTIDNPHKQRNQGNRGSEPDSDPNVPQRPTEPEELFE
ncbi:MAG: Flp pilus assembly protein CpaB [Planctomycetota bacterium]|nr:MAG: Flp pilus assembly protein CpaB [Planctomycetota bacterium]